MKRYIYSIVGFVCTVMLVVPTASASALISVAPQVIDESPSSQKQTILQPLKKSSQNLTIADVPDTVPSPVPATDDVLISAFGFTESRGFDFIELHNTSDDFVDISDMKIKLRYSTPSVDYACEISPHGAIRPGLSVTYMQSEYATKGGVYAMNGCPQPEASSGFDREIAVYRGERLVESDRITDGDMAGQTSQQWQRKGWTASHRKGILSTDFENFDRTLYTSELYIPPKTLPLKILEVFPNPDLCATADTTPTCRPYIKIQNTSDKYVNLANFRLRSGSPVKSSSHYNTSSLAGMVAPHMTYRIDQDAIGNPLALNNTSGATWFEDASGIQTYANDATPYEKADLVAHAGLSWAFDPTDSTWKWAVPAPYSPNNNFHLPTEHTSTESPKYKPCTASQYRSPETHRCRSLFSSKKQYKPCAPNQTRNPETHRCRSVLSASTSLKPCNKDQERNPKTNRCRKIQTKLTNADFAVEPVKQGTEVFAGWWALGGLAVLVVGYAAWEWHSEISRLVSGVVHRDR